MTTAPAGRTMHRAPTRESRSAFVRPDQDISDTSTPTRAPRRGAAQARAQPAASVTLAPAHTSASPGTAARSCDGRRVPLVSRSVASLPVGDLRRAQIHGFTVSEKKQKSWSHPPYPPRMSAFIQPLPHRLRMSILPACAETSPEISESRAGAPLSNCCRNSGHVWSALWR